MTDDARRQRVEEVCDAALERDAPDRAAFVASACGSDEALRREVESLLAHAQAAELFLESPIGHVAAHVLAGEARGPLLGRQLGPYRILALLGAGGMGEVYRARDTKLGRDVAVKVVADAFLSSPERLTRFEREAQVLATLNHPHIGAIYGLEEADGVRGLVLELVEGPTLAERLAAGPLPVKEALAAAGQIADALEAAHEKGIIHRDLKPANIKITPDGIVKVLDFGVAKIFTKEDSAAQPPPTATVTTKATVDGVIAGTAAYMSPEQARGSAVDKRTDIWAFGCVVYEMLTARAAFAGETAQETIAAIFAHEPDWHELPVETPRTVVRLLQRCLEKDPKRRVRDIGDARLEIEEALGAIAQARRTVTEPAGIVSSPKPAITKVATLPRLAVAAAAVLAIGTVAVWQLQRAEYFWRDPLEGATSTALTDFEGAEHHAAISSDGKFVAFLSDRAGTWDAWAIQLGTDNFNNLTKGKVQELRNPATRTLGFSPDGTHVLLWSRVHDPVKGGVVNAGWAVPTMGGQVVPYLKGIPETVSEIDFSPDGRRMVYHPPVPGDPLFVAERDSEKSGRPLFVREGGFHNHFPVWSHDGEFIYFVHGQALEGQVLDRSDVWRIRPSGGDPERITFHDSRVTFPTFLDNRTLLYLATDEEGAGPWVYAIDVERRIPHRVFTGVGQYRSLAASSDGRRLVTTESRATARVWSVPITDAVAAATDAKPVPLPTTNGLSPRHGRGFIIYRAPKAGTESLWKLADNGAATPLASGRDGRVTAAAVAPDGRVAYVVHKRIQQLYLMNADATGVHRIAGDLDVIGTPAWSPDGQWLAIAANRDGKPRLFKIPVANGGGAPVPLGTDYGIDPIWSPSGRLIVYSGRDVGTNFPVKAMTVDGVAHELPDLKLTRGARRMAFLREDALVVMKGDVSHKEFSLVDLKTGRDRQLTSLGREFVIGDFDLSPDGRWIIFDRLHEESDIVLIDRPPAAAR